MMDAENRKSVGPGRYLRVKLLSSPVLLAVGACFAIGARSSDEIERVARAAAHRADLTVTVRACGLVESGVRTVIRFQVENIAGKRAASTILDLAPAGRGSSGAT